MKKAVLGIIIVLLLGGVGTLGFLYMHAHKEVGNLKDQVGQANSKLDEYKSNPEAAAQAEVDKYIEAVGKLYALPSDEKPSVATVNDKAKLKDQPFFANAENGDVTLIYADSKLALLYRPSTKQIVNVSSVTIQQDKKTN